MFTEFHLRLGVIILTFPAGCSQRFAEEQTTVNVKPLTVISAEHRAELLASFAGDYYFGDGMGVNCSLTLTPEGTFAFLWRGCLGINDQNKGDVQLDDALIRVVPKSPNRRDGFRGMATEFFPVRWGKRVYLVATDKIVEFCSDVNQGEEPRTVAHGMHFLRRDDWDTAVDGKPAVPERWAPYLLTRPVHATITQLVDKQEAWIDVGADGGLLDGMILTARDDGDHMFSQVRVEQVESNRSRVKCQWEDSELVAGQTVSSRFHE